MPDNLVYLTGPAKVWLTLIGVVASFDGVLWIATPGLSTAPPYDMATSFAAPELWGWAMTVCGLLAWGSVRLEGRRWAIELGRLALALYGVITFVIGLSTLGVALVRPDLQYVVILATKWWAISASCFLILGGPTMSSSRQLSLRRWFGR